ncbi:dynein regulatory complex protein 10 [Plutella xylostella]|uniref:dynein regulatory complex protein 10 n=1 Tax=Plutella xylostella TaxID=51655 RepID=UPI002032C46C|nr:dynein regulatory complex protein 10 [Plutella xylostella]
MEIQSISAGTLQSTQSTSSKSASSRSSQALDSQPRDEDFTKDNSASPIDLECYIQAERISKILGEAIFKTKLALCIPHLVQDFKNLSAILSAQDMEELIFIFEQYENPRFSGTAINAEALEDIKSGVMSLKHRLNPELSHLLAILNSYPDFKPMVEDIVKEMKQEYVIQEREDKPQSHGLEYLLTLERFRELMQRQTRLTAAAELAGKMRQRKIEASNDGYIDKIHEYTKLLHEENTNFEKSIKDKKDIIAKLEAELSWLESEASIKLKKKILDSDRQMVLASRQHAVKHELLKDEETEVRTAYETLLKTHLADEKNQRQRRFKVETQLVSWLQKYDAEMGDKQAELDEFTDKLEEEERRCRELEEQLAEQDKAYLPLMEEREAEYEQEMMQKMHKFMLEHAARVVQTAWREVLANRAEKKKLRKLQKKIAEGDTKKSKKLKEKLKKK